MAVARFGFVCGFLPRSFFFRYSFLKGRCLDVHGFTGGNIQWRYGSTRSPIRWGVYAAVLFVLTEIGPRADLASWEGGKRL